MSDEISTLIGILLDVSGSMEKNVGDGVEEEGGAWVRSIFRVIDDLIKYDLTGSNLVFSVGVGASCSNEIFDLINTLQQFENTTPFDEYHHMTYDEMIDRILDTLERNGAGTVKKWATRRVIRSTVSSEFASSILRILEADHSFVEWFVNDCLPPACRDSPDKYRGNDPILGALSKGLTRGRNLMYKFGVSVASTLAGAHFPTATEGDMETIVNQTKDKLIKLVSVESSILRVKKASEIIHGCVDEEKLTESRIKELKKSVTPFIYGGTPLYGSLNQALQLFSKETYCSYKKLLFIVSDGAPSDDGNRYSLSSKFKEANITVVSCFITKLCQVEPRVLHSKAYPEWEEAAKLLFHLSSTIHSQSLPRTIFIKRGWKFDDEENINETKLFLHVNHPDHLREACDLARNVVCCQDALSDVLASVSLDVYINKSVDKFSPTEQEGGTCYAHASATVLHLSMKRILGREGGYPDFNEILDKLIERYGRHGANTLDVLQEVCPQYRLRCQKVDLKGALQAVTAGRPVLARFQLTQDEWNDFERFYRYRPTSILTKDEVNILKRRGSDRTFGHAVVLTSYNSECLRLMNSRGTGWGDLGFFKVQTAGVLGLEFIDVFWKEADLNSNEKEYFAKHGSEVAENLMKRLVGLQRAEYQCPLCSKTSLVTEFTGELLRVKCPKCHGEFRSDDEGNILALNMYLTSLSKPSDDR